MKVSVILLPTLLYVYDIEHFIFAEFFYLYIVQWHAVCVTHHVVLNVDRKKAQ